MIRWTATPFELVLISKIADRALRLAVEIFGHSVWRDKTECTMDLEAVHSNGCPLDLEKLLAFPNPDFAHDVFGIHRHVNRSTGELQDCFLPRCARPVVEGSREWQSLQKGVLN